MSWYPPPQDPYAAAAAYGGYAPPPPPPQPAYYGYQAAPPPPQHQPYPHQQPHAYGRYDYAAYAGYAQAPPPPQAAPPPPQAPPHHHYYGYHHQQPSHSPAPPPVASPPPPQQPPLREGELRPPPDVGVDPNSFRRFFAQQLQGLTFNSKPIITALTLFAHEHLLRMSGVVAQCLDEHLRSCPPQHVLPTFYLLDSISKNIGPPYLALFGRFLERAFLQAYHGADASTRTKLEELLGTWKTGGADGGELFRAHDEPREGGKVQRGIEGALFGARGRGDGIVGKAVKDADMYNAGVQQVSHTATSTERSGVLYDVRRLLALRTEAPPASDPTAEANNQSQIVALKKLESLILNTQLTTEQVNQIRAQLKALTPAPAPVPSPSPAPPAPVAAVVEPAAAAASLTPQLLAPTAPSHAHGPAPSHAHGPSPSPAPVPAADSTPAPPAPSSLVGGIDLGLLSQLSASGALANLFAPSASPGPSAPPAVKLEDALAQAQGHGVGQVKAEEEKPQPLGQGPDKDEMARGWEDEILRLNVGLTNAEVAAPRPQAPSLLYLALALPCAQCGLRFFASASGKKKMDQHLDWHFKHKRRVREAAGRTAGRGWFTGEEAWYASDETTGEVAPSAGFSTSGQPTVGGTSSSAAAAAATIDRAALRKLKVPVPPASATGEDGGLGDKPCPVCQDKLKSEWSDDEEEWVWWNAVVVDGTLYHATCHAEATQAQQQRAAAASTTGTGTRALPSRESTPASAAAASRKRPAPAEEEVSGEQGDVKREEGVGAQQQGEGEPQLKRVKSEPGLGEGDE
ncbi:hypothetical protein JCM8208_006643 [Rhodotorula glutinis]